MRLTGSSPTSASFDHHISVINVLVDPVAFLVLNGISPPPHWGVNNSVPQQDQAGNVPSSPLVVSQDAPVGLYLASSVNVSYNIPTSYTAAEWLLTSTPGLFGLVSGWANPTGVILLLVLSVMVICSMKWVRKSGNFEVRMMNPCFCVNNALQKVARVRYLSSVIIATCSLNLVAGFMLNILNMKTDEARN